MSIRHPVLALVLATVFVESAALAQQQPASTPQMAAGKSEAAKLSDAFVGVAEKASPSRNVTADQSTVASAAPYASHVNAGWCRRGEWRKSKLMPATTNRTPSGHRVICQPTRASRPSESPTTIPLSVAVWARTRDGATADSSTAAIR